MLLNSSHFGLGSLWAKFFCLTQRRKGATLKAKLEAMLHPEHKHPDKVACFFAENAR